MSKQLFFAILEGSTSHTTESEYICDFKASLENHKDKTLSFLKDELSIRLIKNFGCKKNVYEDINSKLSKIKYTLRNVDANDVVVVLVFDDDNENARKNFKSILSKIESPYRTLSFYYKDGNFDNFLVDLSCQKSLSAFKTNVCESYKERNSKLFQTISKKRSTKDGISNLHKFRNNYSNDAKQTIEWVSSCFSDEK